MREFCTRDASCRFKMREFGTRGSVRGSDKNRKGLRMHRPSRRFTIQAFCTRDRVNVGANDRACSLSRSTIREFRTRECYGGSYRDSPLKIQLVTCTNHHPRPTRYRAEPTRATASFLLRLYDFQEIQLCFAVRANVLAPGRS